MSSAPRSRAKTSDLSDLSTTPPTSTSAIAPEASTPSKKRRLPFLGRKKSATPLITSGSSTTLQGKPSRGTPLPVARPSEPYFASNMAKYVIPSPTMSMLPSPIHSSRSQASTLASMQSSSIPPISISPTTFSPRVQAAQGTPPKRNAFYYGGAQATPPPKLYLPTSSNQPLWEELTAEGGRQAFDLHTCGNSGPKRPPLPTVWTPPVGRDRSNSDAKHRPPIDRPLLPPIPAQLRLSRSAALTSSEGRPFVLGPCAQDGLTLATSSTCSSMVPTADLITPPLSVEADSYLSHTSTAPILPSRSSSPKSRRKKPKHSISIMRELEQALGTEVGLDSDSGTDSESISGGDITLDGSVADTSSSFLLDHNVKTNFLPGRSHQKARPAPLLLKGRADRPRPAPTVGELAHKLPTPPSSASTFASAQHGHYSPASCCASPPAPATCPPLPGAPPLSAPPSAPPAYPPPCIPLPPAPSARPASVSTARTTPRPVLPSRSRSNTIIATISAPRSADGTCATPRPPLLSGRRASCNLERRRHGTTGGRAGFSPSTHDGATSTDGDSGLLGALETQRARCDWLASRLAQMSTHHAEERAGLVRQVERLKREAKKHEREIKGLRWLVINSAGIGSGSIRQELVSARDEGAGSVEDMRNSLRRPASGLGLNLPDACASSRADANNAGGVLVETGSLCSLATSGSEGSLPSLSASSTARSALSSILESPLSPSDVSPTELPHDARRNNKDARHASWALRRLSVAPDPFSLPPYTPSPPLEDQLAGRGWLAQASSTYAALLARGRERDIAHERRATADMEIALERLEKADGQR